MTAMFLFLSFCLAGDWFCQFHRVHVPGNMPGAFYLLSFSADALLEQEALQQRVYWNSWWVRLCACPSKPLPEKHLGYLSVIASKNFHLVRQYRGSKSTSPPSIWYITESVKSFPFFSSSVFRSVDLFDRVSNTSKVFSMVVIECELEMMSSRDISCTNKPDTSKEPKRQKQCAPAALAG